MKLLFVYKHAVLNYANIKNIIIKYSQYLSHTVGSDIKNKKALKPNKTQLYKQLKKKIGSERCFGSVEIWNQTVHVYGMSSSSNLPISCMLVWGICAKLDALFDAEIDGSYRCLHDDIIQNLDLPAMSITVLEY